MERAKKRIAIIGSGISGLVAAYEVNKAIQAEHLPFEFIVLESRSSVGGMIKTFKTEDGAIDVGASSFDSRRGDVRLFLAEIGLADQVQWSNGGKLDRFSGYHFISSKKQTYHGIPIHLTDIIYDKELSFRDKVAVVFNHSFHHQVETSRVTTKQFLDERFSSAVTDLIAYPNYPENIYGSLELCPPDFFDATLVKLFEDVNSRSEFTREETAKFADEAHREYTLIDGMSTLVQRLTDFFPQAIETNKQLTQAKRIQQGILMLTLNEKEDIRVGCVISTIPLSAQYDVFQNQWGTLPKPTTASMGTVLFQFKKGVVTRYPDGFGFVVPKRSPFHITKGIFINKKWPSFSDSKHDYLVVDIGRRQEDKLIHLPDEVILQIVEKELTEILALQGTYDSARIFRWHDAIPHLTLDDRAELISHEERFKEGMEQRGIYIGGNGFHGYGLHNAIAEGKRLAEGAIQYMKKRNNIM